jgi:hypothetical protein
LLSNDPKLNKLAIKTLELDMLIKNGGIKWYMLNIQNQILMI